MVGWTRMVHFCLHCDYREIDENWPRPKLTLVSSQTAAERLRSLRMGEAIPLHYDAEPFPAGDLA
jgi:hypothetical protein